MIENRRQMTEGKGREMERKIAQLIEDLKPYNPEKIILFGSAAREDSDEYSDMDVVVIKKTNKRFLERLIETAEMIRPSLGPIDVFVYTPEEFGRMKEWDSPFIEEVLKEGRIIYETR